MSHFGDNHPRFIFICNSGMIINDCFLPKGWKRRFLRILITVPSSVLLDSVDEIFSNNSLIQRVKLIFLAMS